MDEEIQKKFYLKKTSKAKGGPTFIMVRKANEINNRKRIKHLKILRNKFSDFIAKGRKTKSEMRRMNFNVEFIYHLNDKLHRFLYIKEKIIYFELALFDVQLMLSDCNIKNADGKQTIKFRNGKIESRSFKVFWGGVPLTYPIFQNDLNNKIYKYVLEMNPAWIGETERICDFLIKENQLEEQLIKIKEQTLKSAFVTSKDYLYSLMKEINNDKFDGEGRVEIEIHSDIDPSNDDLWLKTNSWCEYDHYYDTHRFDKRISLYIPKSSRTSGLGYIRLIENGRFEIKIWAERDNSNWWDTEIDAIQETLREVINWWGKKGFFTQQEYDDYKDFREQQDEYQLEQDSRRAIRDFDYET